MGRQVVIFEDDRVCDLYPLTLTRPAFDLACGCASLGAKTVAALDLAAGRVAALGGCSIWFHARDYLRDTVSCTAAGSSGRKFVKSFGDLCRGESLVTLINARLVSREGAFDDLDFNWIGKYLVGDAVAVANLPKDRVERLSGYTGVALGQTAFADLPSRPLQAAMAENPWDLVARNADEIVSDFRRLGGSGIGSDLGPGVHLVNETAIRMGRDVALSPGVVVDASSGPVNIEAGVTVMANAGLCGPLHLGANAIIKMGATIYGGTSVGQVSKVGGEVAESIVAGYSNKQHQGFLGHSYLGEWVNIGAGTDTSDMKNNYSTVRVRVAGKLADSGRLFLGLVMGDHSKSGIGTTFGAGTTVGVCSNIFGAGYPPKDVPSFAWGGASQFVEHRLAAALETARRVMARRGVTLGGTGEEILRAVFTSTADERGVFLRR
jgi:UDP-N-acetylglucosamine diphosphorylase/glucosamine-1-phosphate N-acetyltransferase